MNVKEYIYYSSPAKIQNLLVSLAGSQQFKRRYRNLASLLALIERIESFSEEEKSSYQDEELERIIRFCGQHIPFYQRLFSEYGINCTQISSKHDLMKIPILSKQSIISNIDSFIDPTAKNYITQKTSGTTGTPFTIHMNSHTYELAMALLVNHEIKNGVNFQAKRATFAGRLIKRYSDNRPPFYRFNKSENQAIFSSYHLSRKTLQHYDQELSDFEPEELIGYPSALYNLALLYKESSRLPSFQPKVIVTNSETLFSWQRELIERTFGCSVYDYYGTAEYVLFAGQNQSHSYTVSPILGIHEIVDDNNVRTESGRLICTSLTNTVMPLIRYDIGDIVSGSNSSFSIKNVIGRIDDHIKTPDGRRIGRTGEIFGFFENIKEAQIIQHKIDFCEIKIAKISDNDTISESAIVEKLRSKFGPDISFKIDFVSHIERGSNGKFKAVKSYI